jgi:hypothetical protein
MKSVFNYFTHLLFSKISRVSVFLCPSSSC